MAQGTSGRRPKEVFTGPRLGVVVPSLVRARSAALLVLFSVVLGVVLAAAVATGVWYLVQAIVHALGSGFS